ncbi:MAG: WecB/TagA/CpsF family glycosyltransferase [Candidatus Omnitrophica bacterium]|nr:WecB/TagA/CpsF family glycosyltransferase [Candidatus Omnitrophota bacterium]
MTVDTVQEHTNQNFQAHQSLDLLGVKVSDVNIPKAVAIIRQWISSRHKTYVCVAPVATLVDCQNDPDYRRIINSANMVTPDGMPVVWLGRASGSKTIDRTYGPDLMLAACQDGQQTGHRHFFYGSNAETLDLLDTKLRMKFPAMNIVGKISPDFKPRAVKEDPKVINAINQVRPDILWVGLGSPKQDFWIDIHRPLLDVPVIVGVGAAFDFLSGVKPQAPVWIQRSGFEWLFRLCSEPRRLWKRYLFGNSAFIYYVCRSYFKKSRT